MVLLRKFLIGAVVVFLGIAVWIFLPADFNGKEASFVVSLNDNKKDVSESLYEGSFIKIPFIFDFFVKNINPGGYKISKSMNLIEIIETFNRNPYMKWVVVPEGLRKEEIADIFAEKFNWSELNKQSFVQAYPQDSPYFEGVYFPDTYLVPANEKGKESAERMINKFNEEFAPYAEGFLRKNIKWTAGLKVASLIQKEAAGEEDMALISGVIWNRLLDGMKLDIDATVRYANGRTDEGWWAPITKEDKEIDSPYNTYKYEGLPPTPIASPGLSAVEAALNPEETDCFYYLHDDNGQLHCSATYKEHRQNMEEKM